jgi:hypothetical protein
MLYWRFHCSIQTANSIKQNHETIVHKELVIVRWWYKVSIQSNAVIIELLNYWKKKVTLSKVF